MELTRKIAYLIHIVWIGYNKGCGYISIASNQHSMNIQQFSSVSVFNQPHHLIFVVLYVCTMTIKKSIYLSSLIGWSLQLKV